MMVHSVMSKPAVTTAPDVTIADAARLMRARRVGCIVVTKGGPPIGILTESDIVRLVAEGRDAKTTRMKDVMASPVATIEPAASLDDAAELMRTRKLKRIVVVLGNEIRGVLTARDVAYAHPEIAREYLRAVMARPEE